MSFFIEDLILAVNGPIPRISIYSDIDHLHLLRISKDLKGQYLWQANFEIGKPSTFIGIPIYRCEESGLRVRHSFGHITLEFKLED